VVLRGLASDPDERFATAHEMLAALEAAILPAPSREVAAWVLRLIPDRLAERSRLVDAIESAMVAESGEMLAPAGDRAGLVAIPPPRARARAADDELVPARRGKRGDVTATLDTDAAAFSGDEEPPTVPLSPSPSAAPPTVAASPRLSRAGTAAAAIVGVAVVAVATTVFALAHRPRGSPAEDAVAPASPEPYPTPTTSTTSTMTTTSERASEDDVPTPPPTDSPTPLHATSALPAHAVRSPPPSASRPLRSPRQATTGGSSRLPAVAPRPPASVGTAAPSTLPLDPIHRFD
jgi:hypothetical protein